MAPTINYATREAEPAVLYNEFRPNEQLTRYVEQVKNNDSGTEKKDSRSEEFAEGKQQIPEKVPAQACESDLKGKKFQIGDKIIFKDMEIKHLKKLQKKHGGWLPEMKKSVGKHGTIVHIFDEGALRVAFDDMEIWTLNPQCVALVERAPTQEFKKGEKARIKNVPVDEMKQLQKGFAVWVPLLEDMKNRLCVVESSYLHRLRVRTMDGYVFAINSSLLEKVEQDTMEEQYERCYKKGDIVRIKDIEEDEMKQLCEKYGLYFDKDLIKARNKKGKIKHIQMGRGIHVRMDNRMTVLCCPPILHLEKENTDSSDSSDDEDIGLQMWKEFQVAHEEIVKALLEAQRETDSDSSEDEEGTSTPKEEIDEKEEQQQEVSFQEGDKVRVKDMDIAEMKKKQNHHGGWNSIMKSSRGKHGTVVHIFPSGDLHISMDDSMFAWCFNPKCVTLVERSETHCFKKGQQVRFRNLPIEEMKKYQEHYGGWVPLMADMRGKPCKIRIRLARQLEVKMMDGYVWYVNPKLIEPAEQEIHEEQHLRCFRKGDRVKITDMAEDKMKELYKHHGIQWTSAVFHAKGHEGVVTSVFRGRVVKVKMENGKTLSCCRPILNLEEESKDDSGDSSDDEDLAHKIEEIKQRMVGSSHQEVSITRGPGGIQMVISFSTAESGSPKSLLIATATGDTEATHSILKRHPHWVDTISENGENTALMNACAAGHIDVVKILIEAGARIDMDNIDGNTALLVAAWKDEKDILEYLLENGATLSVTNARGQNALHSAIAGDAEECVNLLLERCGTHEFQMQDESGTTPVGIAIRKNNKTICDKMFASKHFKASFQNKYGFTALHEAAKVGNEFAAKIILDVYPQGINEQKLDKWTPLHLAAFNNNVNVLKALLFHKDCDCNALTEHKETALFLAVKRCHKGIAQLLLENKTDPNIQNKDGETCLHQVFKLQDQCIHMQLDARDIDISNVKRKAFGQEDVLPQSKRRMDLAILLISKGASVDVVDKNGKTPLDNVKDEKIKAEILKRARVDVVDENSKTPLDSIKDEKIKVELLKKAPVDVVDENGKTPLDSIKDEKIKAELLKKAPVDVVDENGKTPLDNIKDEEIKTDISIEIEAANSKTERNLTDFHNRLKEIKEDDWVKQIFQTNTFAARYFDYEGGYLEIEAANVRLYIPPGAVNEPKQLVYINLDLINHNVEGRISPVVQVGPPRIKFKKKVMLSYPHCALKESQWKFTTLISDSVDPRTSIWKDVNDEEGVECIVQHGRAVIKTLHFTRFTTTGEPSSAEGTKAEKNMRIGAFGNDHRKGKTSYQFRVRAWEDTTASTLSIREKELGYLKSKPIDDDRPLRVQDTKQDVSIKVDDIEKGWQLRNEKKADKRLMLPFDDVWHNRDTSCTVDLDKTCENNVERVQCTVAANQIGSSCKEVYLSISPETISHEEDQEIVRSPASSNMKEELFGKVPDIPNLSEASELYLRLVCLLGRKDDVNGDWRTIMSEIDGCDAAMIAYIEKNKPEPANFALKHYLQKCRVEKEGDPVGDLQKLFEKTHLHEALQCVLEWKDNQHSQ